MTGQSYPVKGVRVERNIWIPMRDQVRLAADLYLPELDGEPSSQPRYPVVMEYIPYRKDDLAPGARFFERLVQNDYAVVRVDIRGTGASEGVSVDEYLLHEQLDGFDCVEWLAQQPWCDGQVNLLGLSSGGFTALQVASHNPPHLKTIIPIDFTDDRYTDDCNYRGGLLRLYYDICLYGNFMIAYNALPPDPATAGAGWAETWERHLTENEPYLLNWYRQQTDGPYWRNGSVGWQAEKIRCPAFLIGGWRDGYPNPPLRLYEALQVPKKVLVGPWNHAFPDSAIPGPRIDYLHEVVRWLDHWCKSKDTGIMSEPPVVVYMQRYEDPVVDRLDSAGQWRAEIGWPVSGATEQVLYLREQQSLSAELGTPGNDAFDYHPAVGVTGGLWSGGVPFGLPGDQRPDEALSLVYSTAPLVQEVAILGSARAVLQVSSSATVVGFAVSLCDVAPDGTSHLIAKGMLNATRRESWVEPKPLVPGEIYELDIKIDATGWVFSRGHRIRLSVASADWPNVWPTPERAHNQVFRGGEHQSRLILPVVPAQGSAVPPEFRPSLKPVARHTAERQIPVWKVVHEPLHNRTTVNLEFGRSDRLNSTTLISREFAFSTEVDCDNPASARAWGRHRTKIIRGQSQIESQSEINVEASSTHFHTTIQLEVRLNDRPYFTRHWAESIGRNLL